METYHALTVELVQDLMQTHVASFSPSDIIAVVNWLRDYHGQLEGLEATVSPVLTDDLDVLLQVSLSQRCQSVGDSTVLYLSLCTLMLASLTSPDFL